MLEDREGGAHGKKERRLLSSDKAVCREKTPEPVFKRLGRRERK
jgi:hypothetical protein